MMVDDGILFIERILLANNFRAKYADFDSFYDEQIANSFIVVDTPPKQKRKPHSLQDDYDRKEQVREYLGPKYWSAGA